LDFGDLEFEFVSSFSLPAMPLSKSTEMPENIVPPPTARRDTSSNAWQAGIRILDFDLVFGDAKTFARLCKEFLGHNTAMEHNRGSACLAVSSLGRWPQL
jgi:hypothetical protein